MKKLVNYFNWSGEVFCLSDPHFGHENILKYERTQFESIDAHDEKIASIIEKVKPFNTLVFLGDLGMQPAVEKAISRIQPNVKKVLIMGNHDTQSKQYYNGIFDEVYDGPLFVNKFMVLSHEPIPVSDNFINVHGHLHNSLLDDNYHLNANIHILNYKLLDLGKIYADACFKCVKIRQSFLNEWYGDNYKFTNDRNDVVIYKDTLHIVPKEEVLGYFKITFEKLKDSENIEEKKNLFKLPNKDKDFYKGLNLFSTDSKDQKQEKIENFINKVIENVD